MRHAILAALVVVSLVSSVTFAGYTEVSDVGALPGSAADLTGTGDTQIFGTAGNSDVDMFKIYITAPTAFSASAAGSDFDTQLQLFDALGYGVYANDDDTVIFEPSLLPAGHALSPTSAGTYFLAVSYWSDDPLSTGGEIFAGSFNDVMEPTGPGGSSPISGWDGGGTGSGNYTITLTGVGVAPDGPPAVPVPGSALLCCAGLALMRSVRRRRTAQA